eukprot:EG_transcript_37249
MGVKCLTGVPIPGTPRAPPADGDWDAVLTEFFAKFCEKTDRTADFIDVQPPFVAPNRPACATPSNPNTPRRQSTVAVHLAPSAKDPVTTAGQATLGTPAGRRAGAAACTLTVGAFGAVDGHCPAAPPSPRAPPPATGVPLALIPMLEGWCGGPPHAKVPDDFASKIPEKL